MTYTVPLKLSREELHSSFKVEPQEIIGEAPLTFTLLSSIDKVINKQFYDNECFSLTVELMIDVITVIDRLHIDKSIHASIIKVIDFSGNNLLKVPINLGKC